jgi:hypothetical protein
MSGNQAMDGQDSGQEDSSESGASSGDTAGGGKKDRIADMEARFEMLQDSISEMRNALLSSRTPAQAPVEDIDDDEPLTPSKVKKIVQSSISSAVGQNQSQNERQVWDDKAKADFPLTDPKFQLEVKKEWREQVAAGLNPNHPRALYNVAKIVARSSGVMKKPAKTDAETTHSSEAPSTQRPASAQNGRRSGVSDDDPRLAFYKMKGDRTKDQIEAMKRKLSEKDAASKGVRK